MTLVQAEILVLAGSLLGAVAGFVYVAHRIMRRFRGLEKQIMKLAEKIEGRGEACFNHEM